AGQARAAGLQVVEFGELADIQIVHTCSVTKAAVRDGRQALRLARRVNPDGTVIATGCAARTDPDDLLPFTNVNIVEDLGQAVSLECEGLFPLSASETCTFDGQGERQKRTRALLKIHDGCFFRCSFCIVPNARPVETSKAVEDAVEEAQRYVHLGHKEIVLTGVRITGYSPESYMRSGLVELLKRLGDVPGLLRVRLTSLYPSEVKSELLEAIANSPNACPHLHLALQSGDDEVLKRMNRHYTAAQFEEVAANARSVMPDVSLTTDVIAGFPGETEQAFENTRNLMERVRFTRTHCFTYSPRPGTPGALMDGVVPITIAKKRTRELIRVAALLGKQCRSEAVGTLQQVIVEQSKNEGEWSGLTATYLETSLHSTDDLQGRVASVRITGLTDSGVTGELVSVDE
ncbi:MAG: MiaB/RimO family radical SAM methylthiotransferase, partial [Armatimonadota bacterium]